MKLQHRQIPVGGRLGQQDGLGVDGEGVVVGAIVDVEDGSNEVGGDGASVNGAGGGVEAM